MGWEVEIEKALNKYKKIAKSADQKMRRLEGQVKKTGQQFILSYAYSRAKRDIKANGGNERFDFRMQQRYGERDIDFYYRIQEGITDAERFINAPTSSVTGYEKLNRERWQNFNKALGDSLDRPLTYEEFTTIMETGFYDLVNSILGGYLTAVRVINAMLSNKRVTQRKTDWTANAVSKILDKYKFKNDPGLYKIVQSALRDKGFK